MLSSIENGIKSYPRIFNRALRGKISCDPAVRPRASTLSRFRLPSDAYSATVIVQTVEQQGSVQALLRVPVWHRHGAGEGDSLRWGTWTAAAATATTAAAMAAVGSADSQPVAAAAHSEGIQGLPVGRNAVADAVEAASPWVVNVVSGMSSETGGFKWDAHATRHMGSGFVISHDGLVVTNAHVVEKYAKGVVVVTFNNGEKLKGKVQAMDRRFDLALLKLEVPEGRRLPVAEIGRSLTLRAGEFVVAMGSPQGLSETCTLGIVSATARLRSELVADAQTETMMSDSANFIQTDAAIATGNSGGPLIDLDGRVIGINTLKLSGTEGVGFAIPIDTAWQVVDELRTRGRVDRPQLGMRLVTADTPNAQGNGVMILSVTPGGAADRAGLRFGDMITEFDGKVVAATSEVLQLIGHEVGRAIQMTIRKSGQATTRRLTLVTESDLPRHAGSSGEKPRLLDLCPSEDAPPEEGRSDLAAVGREERTGGGLSTEVSVAAA